MSLSHLGQLQTSRAVITKKLSGGARFFPFYERGASALALVGWALRPCALGSGVPEH